MLQSYLTDDDKKAAKVKMIRALITQMVELMEEGKGDDPAAAMQAMGESEDSEMPLEEGEAPALEEGEEEETFASFMNPKARQSAPMKSRMVVAGMQASRPKSAAQNFMKGSKRA